jgi:phosphatidylglycerophosphatase C
MSRTLALFDFDGTITTRDTLFVFAHFIVGSNKYFLGLFYLAPWLIAHRIGLFSAQKAKEIFLGYFLKGITAEKFTLTCNQFCTQVLPTLIRPRAFEAIVQHKQNGTRIAIVSASCEDWIAPWANQFGIEVIATRLEKKENIITGRIAGLNCNGSEKVTRIQEKINVLEYPVIIAYGDSSGDHAMLELATQKFFKPFRDKK